MSIWDKLKRYFFSIFPLARKFNRGPVRRLLSTGTLTSVAFIGLAATISLTSTTSVSSVHIIPEQANVVVGEQFFIDVRVDAKTAINAVNINIAYPSSLLDITQLRDGESVITIWTEPPTAAGGVVKLSGGTFRRGFIGEHRIIRLTAVAKVPGVIRLRPQDISLLTGDGSGDTARVTSGSTDEVRIVAFAADDVDRPQSANEGASTPSGLTDLTGDGRVTMQDISVFMSAWSTGSPVFDFSGDGRMTFRDFSIILADFFRQR